MKIVIAGVSAPTQLNGVSRHAANIVRGLLLHPGVREIHLLAGAWQTDMFAHAIGSSDSRLRIHPISIPHRNLARVYWYYRDLPRIARRLRADVLHLSYTMPTQTRALACPAVVTLHDLYPFDIPQNFGLFKAAVNRRLMHQSLRSVDAIACDSESTRQRLHQRFGRKLGRKAVTIPSPVEPLAVVPSIPSPLRPDQPFLLSVSQHRVNKNVPLTVKLFAQLLRNQVVPPNTRLLVVGIAGPETRRIHTEIRQCQLEDSVILLSGISDGELLWCYQHCELLLAPSSIEGFGLPVAEAQLAGCRVVCSDIPAFREIDTGVCRRVPFGERILERYEQAIREILARRRPAPLPLPRLSLAAVARQHLALYTRLLAPRPATPSELAFYADSAAEELDPAEAR